MDDKDIGALLLDQGVDAQLWNNIQQLNSANKLVEEGKLKKEIYDALKGKVMDNFKRQTEKHKGDKTKVNNLSKLSTFFVSSRNQNRVKPSKNKDKGAAAPQAVGVRETPILEGELLKRFTRKSGRNKVSWKKRYVVLYQHAIVCYQKKGGSPQESIILNGEWFANSVKNGRSDDDSVDSDDAETASNASSINQIDGSQAHQFLISDLSSKHRFAAETEQISVLWVKTLTAILRSLYKSEEKEPTEPQFLGQGPRTPEQIRADYDRRVKAYNDSKRKTTLAKMPRGKKLTEADLQKEEKKWEMEGVKHARQSMFVDLEKSELEMARQALKEQREEADRAKKEAAELKLELEKDHEIMKQQEEKIGNLEGLMAKLREEAAARREEKRIAVAEAESAIDNMSKVRDKRRRESVRRGGNDGFDETHYQQEIEALKGKLKALQSQLNVDYENLDWDGTLEQAEEKMKGLMPKMMSENEREQMEAQQEFDQWDQIIRSHADYQNREANKWVAWENENHEKNLDALNEMKKLAPQKIMTNCTIADLEKDGLKKKTAKRVLDTKAFHFFWLPKETIAKTHIADLRGRYAIMNFDIREMRALYAALPNEFLLDPDGKKKQYRDQVRNKLFELTEKEKKGTLMPNEEIHNQYRDKVVKGPKVEIKGGKRAKPAKKNAKMEAMAQALQQKLGGTGGDKLRPTDPKWGKFLKMSKMGLPDGAIIQSMKKDGIDPEGWEAAQKAVGLKDATPAGKQAASAKPNAAKSGIKPKPFNPSKPPVKETAPSTKNKKVKMKVDRNSTQKIDKRVKIEKKPIVDEDLPVTGFMAGFMNLVTGGAAAAEEPTPTKTAKVQDGTEDDMPPPAPIRPKKQLGGKKEKSPGKETLKKRQLLDPNAPILAAGTNELVSQAGEAFEDIKLESSVAAVQFDEYGGKQQTKSRQRAVKIGNKIEKSMDELVEIILEHGTFDASQGGQATITFGELFDLYESINDMLVGLLYKGKKKKRIKYKGDLLFKGIHDAIKITAL